VGLPAYIKTTGSSGVHILIPLAGQLTHDESRTLAEIIARLVVRSHADIATLNRVTSERDGRVYIDYLQNGYGKLMAAPFAVRPLPGAPISMPIEWREMGSRLTPQKFTLKNVKRRMSRRDSDPMAPVLSTTADIGKAIEQLLQRAT
ncbi:MAG: DNA ligase, partial [Pseudomonadota bacterium]